MLCSINEWYIPLSQYLCVIISLGLRYYMKTLCVLIGPQGSGNHLWSKIFSLHEEVFGWKTLLDNYWEAHRLSEPFAEYWKDPDTLRTFDWSQSEYFFTSVSIPLGIKSQGTLRCPNVVQFCTVARVWGSMSKCSS